MSEYCPAEHLAGTKIHTLHYGFSIQNEIINRNTVINFVNVVLVLRERKKTEFPKKYYI